MQKTSNMKSGFVVAVKPFAIFAGFRIAAPCFCLLQRQATLDDAVGLVDVWVVKADDVVGSHGSAQGKFLSNQILNLFHVLGNFALCLAALGPVCASKTVLILSLGFCEQLLDGCKFGFDRGHW